ncbi:MAG TPA: glycosyltransferase [Solirubrobacteraceae bacterium]|nr:glycosyltransferase [Solirubrobacteraceae bacterium]
MDGVTGAAGPGSLPAPVAVRVLDIDAPLGDLDLSYAYLGQGYRSLLAVVRLADDPVGVAAFAVDSGGRVTRAQLAGGLHRQLGRELDEAYARRDGEQRGKSSSDLRDFADSADIGPTPSVSVVVRTRRNPSALERCLRSILDCDYDDLEVIVVESRPGSPDTARMLVEQFPAERRLRYVEEPHNSPSLARNLGLAKAEGEIIAFIDDEVVVDAGWLQASVTALLSERKIACVTGLILPLELESRGPLKLEQPAGLRNGFRRRVYRLHDVSDSNPLLPYAAAALGSGASIVMLTEVARALGGFDPALGPARPTIGGEDLDLLVRLLRAGHAVTYEPQAIVWYDHARRAHRLRGQVYRHGVRLGAVVGKHVIAGPQRLFFLRAAPAGLRRLHHSGSREDVRRPTEYPRHLTGLARLGMLVGAVAYVISAVLAEARQLAAIRPPTPRPLRLVRRMVVGDESINVVWFRGTPTPSVRFAWRRVAEREATGPPEPVVLGAAGTCVAALLLVLIHAPMVLRLPFVLALLCVVPGITWVTAVRGRAEPGLIIGVSLAFAALMAQLMLWLGAWWPRPFLYALAVGCLIPLTRRLRSSEIRIPEVAQAGAWLERARRSVSALAPRTMAHAMTITVALLLWALSLTGADLSRINGVGLLAALPPTYFVAFALLLGGFAFAVTGAERRPRLLGAYVLALIVVLHATTAILYDEPRYAWTYPHLGVINLIAATGQANRNIDIYTNWPAFFALNAWFSRTSGVAPIAFAGWAQVAFNLVNIYVVRFALRALTRDERVLWTAALFFVLGNWVGQDYLAPQAFAFPLSLVVLGLCLRCGRTALKPRRGLGRLTESLLARIAARVLPPSARDDEVIAPPVSSRAALVAGAACAVAVIITHQLSPVILILTVFLLALVTRTVPLWIPAAMAVVEVWWVWVAWPFLHAHFSLFDPGSGGAAAANRNLSAAPPGTSFSLYAPAAVMALMALLGVTGWLRRLLHGRLDLVTACCIAAPVGTVAAQSYGGEGVFRAYLFALPWLAFLAALACTRRLSSPSRGAMSRPRLLMVMPAVVLCLLFAYFGEELANRETPDDVTASAWYELHAPSGSIRIDLAPNAPDRLTGRYPLNSLGDPSALLQLPQFTGHRLGAADVPRLERYIRQQGVHPTYVVLTRSQENYGRLNGLVAPGSLLGLRQALERSGSFRLVFHRPTAWIFRYSPQAAS